MPQPRFIHLRVHTEYSLSDGIVRINSLVKAAREAGMPAVAITDNVNVFGLVKFYKAALAAGIKPIAGVDLWLEQGEEPATRITLLARNHQGYRNICELLTKAYLQGQTNDQVLCQTQWLEDYNEGLIALVGNQSDVAAALAAEQPQLAAQQLQYWQQVFSGYCFVELTRTGKPQDETRLGQLLELALAQDCPVVATNDVRFPKADDFEAHEARVAIHDGYTLANKNRPKKHTPQQYLKSPEEMAELFADIPEALENTVRIAELCNLELELGKNVLPDFPVPEGHDDTTFLRAEARDGLERRLQERFPDAAERERQRPHYEERLAHELGVIETMGFPGYFLIVADFIRWSRENDVPVGPGRGSGAGSLVAYTLGITDLDPLEFDLLFERFLNPERVSMPDFDVDFCMDGRDRVIEYVAHRYGVDRVSQIITYGTMAARAVVRDVGRVLGHPYGMVDRIAKQVPFAVGMTLTKALKESKELKESYDTDDEVRYLLDLALSLEGIARNAGKHAGGVVIAPDSLTAFTPLYCEPGGKNRVTQFDKDDVEAVGLVKFDFLGLRTLTIIDHAVKTVNRQLLADDQQPLDIRNIPLDDRHTFKLLKAGETMAVFQLESSGMRRLIKRLLPDAFEDIIALVALYRPGPLESGMVEDFISRKHGRTKVVYPHDSLSEVLEPTYGVILYQEQVMQIAQILAGYSLGGADLLRRAMGKKKPEEMARQRGVFLEGAKNNGIDEDKAAYIFDLVEKFAGYGFNKSHSAAYALLSYQTAWLKQHYPAAFMSATMSADMDHTEKIVNLINECKRLDINVYPPSVNDSEHHFSVVNAGTIRYGLGAIKGLGQGAIEAIVAERQAGGNFQNLYDFCRRVDTSKVNRRALEALVYTGAMDALGPNRASLLHGLPRALAAADQSRKAATAGQDDMFGLGGGLDQTQETGPVLDVLEAWPDEQRLRAERNTLGLYLTGHPIEAWKEALEPLTHGELADQIARMPRPEEGGGYKRRNNKKKTIVAGFIIEVRRIRKANRTILVIDDATARIECSLFDDRIHDIQHLIEPDQLIIVEGEMGYDDFTDGFRMNARQIMDISAARQRFAQRVTVQLDGRKPLQLEQLSQCFKQHIDPDGCRVVVRYTNQQANAILTLDNTKIRVSDEFLDTMSQLTGQDSVQIRYHQAS